MRASSKGSPSLNVLSIAAAGSTQSDATAIPANFAPALVVVSGADDLKGVKLPPAAKGKQFTVKSTGTGGLTSKLNVYPATGDTINALSTNTAIAMAAGSSATFIAASATAWYTIPTVPS
jgi:hypothetical protein